eukprot:Rhum_TRINITY_DN9004_c0_g1::Rhum_TRINITY_DN9004_c0_g1_i1::g.31098::m.31098
MRLVRHEADQRADQGARRSKLVEHLQAVLHHRAEHGHHSLPLAPPLPVVARVGPQVLQHNRGRLAVALRNLPDGVRRLRAQVRRLDGAVAGSLLVAALAVASVAVDGHVRRLLLLHDVGVVAVRQPRVLDCLVRPRQGGHELRQHLGDVRGHARQLVVRDLKVEVAGLQAVLVGACGEAGAGDLEGEARNLLLRLRAAVLPQVDRLGQAAQDQLLVLHRREQDGKELLRVRSKHVAHVVVLDAEQVLQQRHQVLLLRRVRQRLEQLRHKAGEPAAELRVEACGGGVHALRRELADAVQRPRALVARQGKQRVHEGRSVRARKARADGADSLRHLFGLLLGQTLQQDSQELRREGRRVSHDVLLEHHACRLAHLGGQARLRDEHLAGGGGEGGTAHLAVSSLELALHLLQPCGVHSQAFGETGHNGKQHVGHWNHDCSMKYRYCS